MNITWTDECWNDYLYWQTNDKKILRRINQLIKDIQRNGNEGLGKPERLRHQYSGAWSRRITAEHRLIYMSSPDNVIIISCRYHY